MALYQVRCQENEYPGMWQRCYRNQCVGIGWPPASGYHLDGTSLGGRGWTRARNVMRKVEVGDWVVATLKDHRVGRLGCVTKKLIADHDWNPLVPASNQRSSGEMGRRLLVRWDLSVGPDNRDLVVELPPLDRFASGEIRPTISEIRSRPLDQLITAMNEPKNWVGLLKHFTQEVALSNYIAAHPHHLEDGLLPHPDQRIREAVFVDATRADVLLTDRNNKTVIVECKQGRPTIENLDQLRNYMRHFKERTGDLPRGILVHGGSRKLAPEIVEAANEEPKIEIVQHSVDVSFSSCA